ncbi:hypothetical protein ABFX02_11G105600 [Erythranthe guttata]
MSTSTGHSVTPPTRKSSRPPPLVEHPLLYAAMEHHQVQPRTNLSMANYYQAMADYYQERADAYRSFANPNPSPNRLRANPSTHPTRPSPYEHAAAAQRANAIARRLLRNAYSDPTTTRQVPDAMSTNAMYILPQPQPSPPPLPPQYGQMMTQQFQEMQLEDRQADVEPGIGKDKGDDDKPLA